MKTLKTKTLTWIDIKNPKKKDIDYLRENFDFHPLVLEELLSPTLRPKVEHYDHYLFMVTHFPIFNPAERKTNPVELDFLITKNSLITVRYETLKPLEELWTKCKTGKEFKEKCFGENPAFLLHYIINELLAFSFRQLDHITKNINEIEKNMFVGEERTMVEEISIVRRDVLDFRRTLMPQKTILESLKIRGIEFFGKKMEPYFADLVGDYARVWSLLENQKETIESLQNTNDSLLANRVNHIMRVLTVFAVIVFPLTLLAAIFGMNTKYLPLVGHKYDFWIIFGIMLAAMIAMIIFFRKKKWI